MITSETDPPFSPPYYPAQTKRYVYYNRYRAQKSTDEGYFNWREIVYKVRMVMSLVVVGSVMLIVGGLFPLVLSYELFFKSILARDCISCIVLGAKPYFEYDYIMATMLAVVGFMMPIFVIYIFIRIVRSRSFRHDLFD